MLLRIQVLVEAVIQSVQFILRAALLSALLIEVINCKIPLFIVSSLYWHLCCD